MQLLAPNPFLPLTPSLSPFRLRDGRGEGDDQTQRDPMTDKRARNEIIKENSHQLRGTLAEGLKDVSTGNIAEDDHQLIKFHGSYIGSG